MPEEYWIIETAESRIIVTKETAMLVKSAITDRLATRDILDIWDSPVTIIPRDIHLIYSSTREVRRQSRQHGYIMELESREDRAAYFSELGIVDPAI